MSNSLIGFSLAQRAFVVLLVLVLIGAGSNAFFNLPIDAFPDVSTTQVKIILKAPGMTPEEVEARIVAPLEQELLGIPHQRTLRSVAKYALTDITLDFADGTDIYWARQQVSERLAAVMDLLPSSTSGGLAPITTPLGELFMFTIEGDLSLAEKRSLLDWVIRPALRTIEGVADVNSLGGEVRTFEVTPRPQLLTARGITLEELRQALSANNRNDGAGQLDSGEETLFVRVAGAIGSLDDLADIVIKKTPYGSVRVGDVAEVKIGALTRYGAVTKDGNGETVQGLVLGLRGANAQQVVKSVRARLAEIAPSLPKGVHISSFYDRGELVDRAIGSINRVLGEAIALVLVMLFIFLGNLRSALVVALVLPLATLATFTMMRFFAMSANLMSLGGLAIAIGLLVDGAVVVVENIEGHLSRTKGEASIIQVVYQATSEVAVPISAGITIICAVFLPLLTLQGLEGKLFAPVAVTIVMALAASLLLALGAVPVLASFFLSGRAHKPTRLMAGIALIYQRLLNAALARSRSCIAGALIVLLAAGALFPLLGKSFMPVMDEGSLVIQLEKLPSISLAESIRLGKRIEAAILHRVPEVTAIVSRTGSDELGLDPMGINDTDAFLVLQPRDKWRTPDVDWLTGELRQVMADFPGVAAVFTQPIDMRVSEMLTGARGDLAVKIFGPELATLNRLADEIAAQIRSVPGANDTFTVKNDGLQYLQITPNRQSSGRLGINVSDIQNDLRSLIEGEKLGEINENGRRTPLLMRGPDDLRASPADLSSLHIALPSGGSAPLSSLAEITQTAGPIKIERENAQRYAVVQSSVSGRDLVGFVDEVKALLAEKVILPEGYRLAWDGQFANQQRAAQRLLIVVPAALGLVCFLLYSTFSSLRQALLVLANVPFAVTGGIFGLVISGEYLSVPATVGFIALLGIAVLNGVVMVSCIKELLARGADLRAAVVEGAQRRLRPVLMTASITAFGLVPMLFASGPGSEIQRPLAIVVIGGIASSTLLTLFLLPIFFIRYGTAKNEAKHAD